MTDSVSADSEVTGAAAAPAPAPAPAPVAAPAAASAPAPAAAAPADGAAPARNSRRGNRGGRGGKGRARNGGAPAAEGQAQAQTSAPAQAGQGKGPRSHPLLDQLAAWYPALFGAELRPLKRGIFQDLLEARASEIDKDALKLALSIHTRSTRYLTVVAAGLQRHDLQGQPVEAMAPEHVHHALLEVFRRRQMRAGENLTDKLRNRIVQAFEASGLTREDYAERVRGRDDKANALLDEALAEASARAAKDEALLRAFEASGQTPEAFADMYGLPVRQAAQALERARQRRAPAA
jgi:ProP effector